MAPGKGWFFMPTADGQVCLIVDMISFLHRYAIILSSCPELGKSTLFRTLLKQHFLKPTCSGYLATTVGWDSLSVFGYAGYYKTPLYMQRWLALPRHVFENAASEQLLFSILQNSFRSRHYPQVCQPWRSFVEYHVFLVVLSLFPRCIGFHDRCDEYSRWVGSSNF